MAQLSLSGSFMDRLVFGGAWPSRWKTTAIRF